MLSEHQFLRHKVFDLMFIHAFSRMCFSFVHFRSDFRTRPQAAVYVQHRQLAGGFGVCVYFENILMWPSLGKGENKAPAPLTN